MGGVFLLDNFFKIIPLNQILSLVVLLFTSAYCDFKFGVAVFEIEF